MTFQMTAKKPHTDDLKQDFVLITVAEPEKLTYSIIGYESEHWLIRQTAATETDGAFILDKLAKQYEVAVFTSSRRSWFRKYCRFKLVDEASAFDPGEDYQHLPPLVLHRCVLYLLNTCFSSYVRYEESRRQYWIAKRVEVPVPVKEYALRVPFEKKDEAKQCGASWSQPQRQWLIFFELIQDVRPLLKWAPPEDHQFLMNLLKRRQQFEEQYKTPVEEALRQFNQQRTSAISAIQSLLKND